MKQSKKQNKKRIRHAFGSIDPVADLWAKQSQSRAHCRNAFFEGKELFSYGRHYLLGLISEFNGKRIAIVNTEYYSKTTSSHSSTARCAARDAGLIVIETDNGNFESTAVRDYLERKQSAIIDELISFGINGASQWQRQFFRQDLSQFNADAVALGFRELVLTIPSDYWQDALAINRIKETARRDHESRRQLDLNLILNAAPKKRNGRGEYYSEGHDETAFPRLDWTTERRLKRRCA